MGKTKISETEVKGLYDRYMAGESSIEIGKDKGVSDTTIIARFKKAGFPLHTEEQKRKEQSKRYKKTCIEKYGHENAFQSEDIKKKIKETCLDKYGVEHHLQLSECLEKRYETNLVKYGVKHAAQNDKVKKKIESTSIERYGETHHLKTKESREKIEKTCLEKYGAISPLMNDKIKARIIVSNVLKYGVGNPLNLKEVQDKSRRTYMIRRVEEMSLRMEEWGYELLDPMDTGKIYENGEYKGYRQFRVKHNECGTVFKDDICLIPRCPKCCPLQQSKMERGYAEFIRSLGVKVEERNRTIAAPYEIDLWMPDHDIGIEYNGMYYHKEVGSKYHGMKSDICLDHGCKLFHIWEWQREDIVKNRIRRIFGKDCAKIHARKLEFREIDHKISSQFELAHHVHGDVRSSIAFGLFDGDRLVSEMSFRHYREPFAMEIARFCSTGNTMVVGGFSKIMKHAEKILKERFECQKIVTYADRDWSPDYKDVVYYKNGFSFVGNSGPMMWYVIGNKAVSRQKLQKHKLKEMFPDVFDDTLTEQQILSLLKIYPVYNSGNWKFEKMI